MVVNAILAGSLALPVIGLFLALWTASAWWLLLLAPAIIYMEGGVGIIVIFTLIFALTRGQA